MLYQNRTKNSDTQGIRLKIRENYSQNSFQNLFSGLPPFEILRFVLFIQISLIKFKGQNKGQIYILKYLFDNTTVGVGKSNHFLVKFICKL